jgi:hypothetical protein
VNGPNGLLLKGEIANSTQAFDVLLNRYATLTRPGGCAASLWRVSRSRSRTL